MANSSAQVPLNNFVQNGDQTLSELLVSVAAVNGNVPPGVTEIIRDPATGKLISVRLDFPVAVATAAVDAINANPGVPTTLVACPEQLIARGLDATTGIAFNQTLLDNSAGKGYLIIVVIQDRFNLGRLTNPAGGGNVYVDQTDLSTADEFVIQFSNGAASGNFTILSTDTITLTLLGGAIVSIQPQATITILPGRSKTFFITSVGDLFLSRDSSTVPAIRRDVYEEACQFGVV